MKKYKVEIYHPKFAAVIFNPIVLMDRRRIDFESVSPDRGFCSIDIACISDIRFDERDNKTMPTILIFAD